jgi:NAD(P)-dependent dehydrogenase (short-subunit alcohol dehydrogenase family)
MRRAGGGVIVNIASTASFRAEYSTHYVASKHAVIGLTKGFAQEMGADGIRVRAVAPGVVNTEGDAELQAELRHTGGPFASGLPTLRWRRSGAPGSRTT